MSDMDSPIDGARVSEIRGASVDSGAQMKSGRVAVLVTPSTHSASPLNELDWSSE